MNYKKLVLTMVVTFIVANLTGFLIHAVLLGPDYMSVKHLYRPEGAEKLLWINVAYIAFAIGAVWIYAKGVEGNRPWIGQGLRFGIAIWLVLAVPSFLIAYAIQPLPMTLVMKQLGFEFIDKLLIGVVIAALYRKP